MATKLAGKGASTSGARARRSTGVEAWIRERVEGLARIVSSLCITDARAPRHPAQARLGRYRDAGEAGVWRHPANGHVGRGGRLHHAIVEEAARTPCIACGEVSFCRRHCCLHCKHVKM